MKLILILVMVLGIGCAKVEPPAPEPPPLKPPSFSAGDEVNVKGDDNVGIVISKILDNEKQIWQYSVIFESETLRYDENQLELVERHCWRKKHKPSVTAEIEPPSPSHSFP